MYCYILVLLCTTFVVKADDRSDFEAKINSCSSFYTQHGHDTPSKDDSAAFQGYKDFVNMVREHNADPSATYVAEVNCWSTVNTPLPELAVQANEEENTVGGNEGDSPDTYDRRTDNTTTGARSQGSCGSCWAFSAIAALESKYLDLTGDKVEDIDFSEQQMLDCTYEGTRDGCQGGWMTPAWTRLQRNEENILNGEAQRGYIGVDGVCDVLAVNKPSAMSKVVMKSPAYRQIGDAGVTTIMGMQTQNRIWLEGAIAIAYRVETAFYSYKSGIFNTACTGGTAVNHALTLVGYSQQAFIAQNSWGATWGDGTGVAHLSRTSGNMCSMLTYTMYPLMECAWGTDSRTGKCVGQDQCGGCKNNGKCVERIVEGSAWACDCRDGWTGNLCDKKEDTDKCASVDCGDKGKCDSDTGKCSCMNGWSGEKCDKADDKCVNVQCKYTNSECDSATGTCECKTGWSGDTCDKQSCDKRCKNGKVCFWKSSDKMGCTCPGATYGKQCSNKAECTAASDKKVCTKLATKNPEKFKFKCGKNWGKKKCPNACGFCGNK